MNIIISNIKENIKHGRFKNVLETVQKEKVKTSVLIEILRCFASTCDEKNDLCAQKEFLILLEELLKFVSEPLEEKYIESYIYSMYHIFKYYLSKQKCNPIPVLKDCLKIDILPLEILNKYALDNIKSICQLVYNEMVTFCKNEKNLNVEKLLGLYELFSQISKDFLEPTNSLNNLLKCHFILIKCGVPTEIQYLFFIENIEFVERFSKTKDFDITPLIKYSSKVISNFIELGEIKNVVKCCEKLHLFLENFAVWCPLRGILKVCTSIFTSEFTSFNLVDLKSNSDELKEFCRFLIYFMYSLYQLTKKDTCKKITNNANVQLKFCDFMFDVLEFLMETDCNLKCQCKSDGQEFIQYYMIINFSRFLLSCNEISDEFTEMLLKHVDKICEIILRLKNKNCPRWKNFWSYLPRYIYNVSYEYHNKNLPRQSLNFFNAILNYDRKIDVKSTISRNDLTAIFGLMVYIYGKLKEFENALFYAALLAINSDDIANNLSKWLFVKGEARDNDTIKSITICSILTKKDDFYYSALNNRLKTNLLIEELKCYSKKWYSNLPMMSAFRELCEIAKPEVCVQTFAEVFHKYTRPVHLNVLEQISPLIGKYKISKKNKIKDTIVLILANFYLHKQNGFQNMSKNTDNIKECLKYCEQSADRQDIVSAFEFTRLNKNQIELMDKCLSLFRSLFEDKSFDILTLNEPNLFFEILKELAHEYYLQYHYVKSYRCWHFALRIASENVYDRLECLGFMLKIRPDEDLKNESVDLMKKISSEVPADRCDLIYVHLINVAMAYLVRDPKVSMKCYESILDRQKRQEIGDLTTTAYLQLLRFKMQFYGILNEDAVFLVPLKKSYYQIFEKVKSDAPLSMYDNVIMFEIQESLVKIYHELRMDREVKIFGNYQLTLAQSMVLPIRCLNVLYFLTYADIRFNNVDNCRVKRDGYADILSIDQVSWDDPEQRSDEKVDELIFQMDDLNLVESNPSSPGVTTEMIRFPLFLQHENCHCFCCNNVDYQTQILKKYHLDAMWYAMQGQVKISKVLFGKVMEIYNDLIRKSSDSEILHEAFFWAILDYAKFSFKHNDIETVQKIIKDMLSDTVGKKNIFPHLAREVLVLNLHLKVSNEINYQKDELLEECTSAGCAKTPEKIGTIQHCNRIIPKAKTLDLELSEDLKCDLFKTPLKVPTKSKYTTPLTNKITFEIFSSDTKSKSGRKLNLPISAKKHLDKTPLSEKPKKIIDLNRPLSSFKLKFDDSDGSKSDNFDKLNAGFSKDKSKSKSRTVLKPPEIDSKIDRVRTRKKVGENENVRPEGLKASHVVKESTRVKRVTRNNS